MEACRLLDAGFLVCEHRAVSVTAALDDLPVEARRIDVRKTARDAGLLRPQRAYARAPKASPDRERSLLGKYAQSRQATKARAAYGKKPQGRVTASKAAAGKATAGKKAVDMRTAKRKATLRKHEPGKGAGHAARGSRMRGRSG